MTKFRFQRMTETDYKGLLLLVLFILLSIALVHGNARDAHGQNLPAGADGRSFNECWKEFQSLNPGEGAMLDLRIGESPILPMCGGGGEFHITADNAEMVRQYGGWGIIFFQLFDRFPTDEEYEGRLIPIDSPTLDGPFYAVTDPSVFNSEDSVPWYWWIALLVALAALAYTFGRLRSLRGWDVAQEAAAERERNARADEYSALRELAEAQYERAEAAEERAREAEARMREEAERQRSQSAQQIALLRGVLLPQMHHEPADHRIRIRGLKVNSSIQIEEFDQEPPYATTRAGDGLAEPVVADRE